MLKSHRVFLSFFYLLMLILVLQSCRKDRGDILAQFSQKCDSINPITYSNYVVVLLANNCTFGGCHAQGSLNGDYTTYAGVKSKVTNGTFRKRVLEIKDMPSSKSGGPKTLSTDDLIKLECWLNRGAPK